MANIITATGKTSKALAQKVAKQIAQEPLEILKRAGKQVGGEIAATSSQTPEPKTTEIPPLEKEKIKTRDTRIIQALEQELKEIRARKKTEETMKKEEEKMKKEAQQQAVRPVPQIPTRPSRRFLGFGAKQKAESLKTRIEKPLPPTG